MERDPSVQEKALNAVVEAARKTDVKHGTNIAEKVLENIKDKNYEVIQ